jgi:transcriptional regulator with XRE-family HTH domain
MVVTLTPKHLGARVRRAREAAGLSQRAVAAKAGLAREHLLRLEAGRADPSVGNLARIARAIGVELTELVREERRRRRDG